MGPSHARLIADATEVRCSQHRYGPRSNYASGAQVIDNKTWGCLKVMLVTRQ